MLALLATPPVVAWAIASVLASVLAVVITWVIAAAIPFGKITCEAEGVRHLS
ncbi:hypothetical protein BH23GEM8_BH23GEM8_18710 [soil metagenome]